MPTRRSVLAATALGLSSVAGCLQQGGDGDDDPQVGDTTRALPEPLGIEDPLVAGVSDTDLAAIREATGPLTEREDRIGEAARDLEADVDVVDLASIDRVAGFAAVERETDVGTQPAFFAAVVEGSFSVEDLQGSIEEGSDPEIEAHEQGDFVWLAPSEPQQEDETVAVALSERRVLFAVVESADVGTSELATHAIDATTDDAGPVESDDALAATVDDVAEYSNVLAASFDPGVLEEDGDPPEELAGLSAVGLGTTPREDGLSLEAVLRFRSAEAVDPAALEELFDAEFEPSVDDPLVGALSFDGEGSVVRATAEVDGGTYEESDLAKALVIPLAAPFGVPFVTGFSGSAGASTTVEPTPQVVWDVEQREDGHVEVTHAGGDAIQREVEVVYQSDGEQREETWRPEDPIQAGVSYTTEQPVAPGTDLRLVWHGEGTSSVLLEHEVA